MQPGLICCCFLKNKSHWETGHQELPEIVNESWRRLNARLFLVSWQRDSAGKRTGWVAGNQSGLWVDFTCDLLYFRVSGLLLKQQKNKKQHIFLPDCNNIFQALVILPFMQTGSQFCSFKFSSSPLASRWEMSRRRVVHLRIPHTALNTRIPRLAAVHSGCPHTARGLQVKQVADRCRVFLEAWMCCRLMYRGRRGRAGRCFISTWPISQAKGLIN